MDHLQHDIDSLENERGALRDKLKLYAKRGGGHHGQLHWNYALNAPVIEMIIRCPVNGHRDSHEIF